MQIRRPTQFSLAAAVIAAGIASSAQAAILVEYGFNDTLAPSTTEAGVTASNVSETGFTAVYSSSAQEGTKSRAVTLNNIDDVFTTDDYYEFTLTPTGGQALDLTELTYYANISSTGDGRESKYQLRYDDLSNGAGDFVLVGENALLTTSSFVQQSFDLSGVAFDNLTAGIVFRLDVADTGGGFSNSSVRIDDLVVNGSVVPEPATLALLGLGGLMMLPRRRA